MRRGQRGQGELELRSWTVTVAISRGAWGSLSPSYTFGTNHVSVLRTVSELWGLIMVSQIIASGSSILFGIKVQSIIH